MGLLDRQRIGTLEAKNSSPSAVENSAANERIRVNTADSAARSASAAAHATYKSACGERSAARNAALDATVTSLVSLALIGIFFGYFVWWQPAHAISEHTFTAIERMERAVHATAIRDSAKSPTKVPPKFKVSVRTLTTPGEQLQGDDDSNLSDNGTPSDDIASGIGSGG
jgi:hypothetical protein